MTQEQIQTEPRPDFLVDAEIASYQLSAESSIAWNERLGNPNTFKRIGRFLMNSVGIESPEQEAMKYHDGIIQNYADSIGVVPETVKSMSEDDHTIARKNAINETIEAGDVIVKPLPNTEITYVGIKPMGPPRQLGIKHQIKRLRNPEPMPDGVTSLKMFGKKRN